MKKKIIAILMLLVLSVAGVYAYAHYGFSVKCAKCVEISMKDPGIEIQIAWRTTEYKSENGKTYAIYKCAGGHKYWAELK